MEKLIDESKPELVVAVLKRIGDIVREACEGKVRFKVLPFPIGRNIGDFKNGLKEILKQLG